MFNPKIGKNDDIRAKIAHRSEAYNGTMNDDKVNSHAMRREGTLGWAQDLNTKIEVIS